VDVRHSVASQARDCSLCDELLSTQMAPLVCTGLTCTEDDPKCGEGLLTPPNRLHPYPTINSLLT
jgi:hypothetical protein